MCWGHSCGRFNRVDHFGNRVFPVHSQHIYIYALCVYVIYIYTLCVYTVYTIHCRKACTKLELIEQQLLPRDEQGSSTNIHHYSLFGKIRQHDTVQALRRASMTASLRASARHPSIVLRIHQQKSSAVDGFVCGYTSWFSRGRAGS